MVTLKFFLTQVLSFKIFKSRKIFDGAIFFLSKCGTGDLFKIPNILTQIFINFSLLFNPLDC